MRRPTKINKQSNDERRRQQQQNTGRPRNLQDWKHLLWPDMDISPNNTFSNWQGATLKVFDLARGFLAARCPRRRPAAKVQCYFHFIVLHACVFGHRQRAHQWLHLLHNNRIHQQSRFRLGCVRVASICMYNICLVHMPINKIAHSNNSYVVIFSWLLLSSLLCVFCFVLVCSHILSFAHSAPLCVGRTRPCSSLAQAKVNM